MQIIAWMGFIIMILRFINNFIEIFTEKTIARRAACFAVSIINCLLVYFFSVYLFR
jgi:hypothetical protein